MVVEGRQGPLSAPAWVVEAPGLVPIVEDEDQTVLPCYFQDTLMQIADTEICLGDLSRLQYDAVRPKVLDDLVRSEPVAPTPDRHPPTPPTAHSGRRPRPPPGPPAWRHRAPRHEQRSSPPTRRFPYRCRRRQVFPFRTGREPVAAWILNARPPPGLPAHHPCVSPEHRPHRRENSRHPRRSPPASAAHAPQPPPSASERLFANTTVRPSAQ